MKRSITNYKKKQLELFAQNQYTLQNKVILNTGNLHPINYYQERKKFFRSDHYNPQFTYKPTITLDVNRELTRLWRTLLDLRLPLSLEAYIESILYHNAHLYEAQRHIGTEAFAEHVDLLYPYARSKADTVLRSLPPVSFADTKNACHYNAYEIRQLILSYIKSHKHLQNMSVGIDYENTQSIRATTEGIYIGAHVVRNEQNVVRLIVHEIESHMLQRQNIRLNSPLLVLRTQYNRELYAEGMAVYNEITTGTITKSAYDLYYRRLQAVSMLDKSFREIFEYLTQYMKPNKAYICACRVKRGMKDTKKAGGWPKDGSYLLGYQAVSEYLSMGGRMDLLYMTQVPSLGELLLKYNLLEKTEFTTPPFLQS